MAGRISTYVHSDNITRNKGGVIVKVSCDTDFAAKTPAFIEFADKLARMVYASAQPTWEDVISVFPDLEDTRVALARSLRETVKVTDIHIVTL